MHAPDAVQQRMRTRPASPCCSSYEPWARAGMGPGLPVCSRPSQVPKRRSVQPLPQAAVQPTRLLISPGLGLPCHHVSIICVANATPLLQWTQPLLPVYCVLAMSVVLLAALGYRI